MMVFAFERILHTFAPVFLLFRTLHLLFILGLGIHEAAIFKIMVTKKDIKYRTISCSFAYMEDWVLATTVFLFCLLGVLETWVAHVLLSVLMLGDLYLGVGSCCAFLYDWVSACFWDGIWVFEQSVDICLVVWLVIPLSDWDLWCVVGYKVHSMDMVKIMMISCHYHVIYQWERYIEMNIRLYTFIWFV